MRPSIVPVALLLLAAVSCPAQELGVKVERRGDALIVDVDATAHGPLSEA